jgi:hypothetical protein
MTLSRRLRIGRYLEIDCFPNRAAVGDGQREIGKRRLSEMQSCVAGRQITHAARATRFKQTPGTEMRFLDAAEGWKKPFAEKVGRSNLISAVTPRRRRHGNGHDRRDLPHGCLAAMAGDGAASTPNERLLCLGDAFPQNTRCKE